MNIFKSMLHKQLICWFSIINADICYLAVYTYIHQCICKYSQVGDEVWVAKGVKEPEAGWYGVKPSSIGTVIFVGDDYVTVNFPECPEWNGKLSEVERTRPVTIGDRVRITMLLLHLLFLLPICNTYRWSIIAISKFFTQITILTMVTDFQFVTKMSGKAFLYI